MKNVKQKNVKQKNVKQKNVKQKNVKQKNVKQKNVKQRMQIGERMLLNEFEVNKKAVLNASDLTKNKKNMPKIAVSCFSHITFERLVKELNGVEIASIEIANMPLPIYKVVYKDVEVALFMSCVGAPACVIVMEEVFALGVEKVILFGTCGVLDATIKDCSIIIPDFALRDEGTSFHYAQGADEIKVNKKYKKVFAEILEKHQCRYTIGKVWTTDGLYRETKEKVQRRKESGCICVDMECSAVAALADFREKEVFHFFYAADNLDNEEWDARSLSNSANLFEKDKIAILAMELARRIIVKREQGYTSPVFSPSVLKEE